MKKYFLLFCSCFLLLLAGCSNHTNANEKYPITAQEGETAILLGETIYIEGEGAQSNANAVAVTTAGTYRLQGSLNNGMVEISAPEDTVQLILDDATIRNEEGPAILVSAAKAVTITLAKNSQNQLADGGQSDYDTVIYSACPLTFSGSGFLQINGNVEEGVVSESDLLINDGNYRIITKGDGLQTSGREAGSITISDGYLYMEAGGNGIASKSDLTIHGGTIISQSGAGAENGGLQAGGKLLIQDGIVLATGKQLTMPDQTSRQKSIALQYDAVQKAGTVTDIRFGQESVLAFVPALDYQVFFYSAPALKDGETYTLYHNSNVRGKGIDGVYVDGASGGELAQEVSTESVHVNGRKAETNAMTQGYNNQMPSHSMAG